MNEVIGNTGSISIEITSASGTGIITILDVAAINAQYQALEIDYFVGYEFYLEALQVTTNLQSFSATPAAAIGPEDTDAERAAKLYENIRLYKGLGLALFKSVGSSGFKRQSLAVLQHRGIETYFPLLSPYLTAGEVKLLGKTDKVGVQLTNIGKGTLGTGDSLLIEGSWRQVISLIGKKTQELITKNFGEAITKDVPKQILSANSKRRFLWVTNPSNERVWFNFGSGTNLLNKSPFVEPKSSINLELERYQITDTLWAFCEAEALLTGLEGVPK